MKSYVILIFLAMMKSKDVVAGESENEFDVDEPEELSENSDGDEWAPSTAVCVTNTHC